MVRMLAPLEQSLARTVGRRTCRRLTRQAVARGLGGCRPVPVWACCEIVDTVLNTTTTRAEEKTSDATV